MNFTIVWLLVAVSSADLLVLSLSFLQNPSAIFFFFPLSRLVGSLGFFLLNESAKSIRAHWNGGYELSNEMNFTTFSCKGNCCEVKHAKMFIFHTRSTEYDWNSQWDQQDYFPLAPTCLAGFWVASSGKFYVNGITPVDYRERIVWFVWICPLRPTILFRSPWLAGSSRGLFPVPLSVTFLIQQCESSNILVIGRRC